MMKPKPAEKGTNQKLFKSTFICILLVKFGCPDQITMGWAHPAWFGSARIFICDKYIAMEYPQSIVLAYQSVSA
jgi:hypothetical protein